MGSVGTCLVSTADSWDGDREGNSQRFRNYTYTSEEDIQVGGLTFSQGWDLTLPGVKEDRYEIRPLIEGQLNRRRSELLAEVVDPKGELAGLYFLGLPPGARNPDVRLDFRNLLRKV